MHKLISLPTGKWNEWCYIVFDSKLQAILIDPGDDFDLINAAISTHKLDPLAILCTHAHFDHIAAVEELKNYYQIPFYLHRSDIPLLKQANLYRHLFDGKKGISIPTVDVDLSVESILKFGDIIVRVIDAPGHTEGGVCFLIDDMLFIGDNLYNYKIGTTKLPGGNREKLMLSIKKLLSLEFNNLRLLAGHGNEMSLSEVKAQLEIN
jgi:glyoxylase-like metal-dependent hydrolase (beta-lactamase superfamily II)